MCNSANVCDDFEKRELAHMMQLLTKMSQSEGGKGKTRRVLGLSQFFSPATKANGYFISFLSFAFLYYCKNSKKLVTGQNLMKGNPLRLCELVRAVRNKELPSKEQVCAYYMTIPS